MKIQKTSFKWYLCLPVVIQLFISSCSKEPDIYDLQLNNWNSSIEGYSVSNSSQKQIALQISKSPQLANYMKIIREKNEKYKEKKNEKFLDKNHLLNQDEFITKLNKVESVEELYLKIYKNPSEELLFIKNCQNSILILKKTFSLLDKLSEKERSLIFKIAIEEYLLNTEIKTQKLKVSDCPWNCNVDFNVSINGIDILLGIGMIACVWGTDGIGYPFCVAAAAYAYDIAWNQALESLGTCFLRCAEP